MNTEAGAFLSRRKVLFVELVAKLVLAFAIGLASALALAGVVVFLAHDAQAAECVSWSAE